MISKCVLLVQSYVQISGLVDFVAQNRHHDPHLFLSNCYRWCCLHPQTDRKMAAMVPDIIAKPKYFQRKIKDHFFPQGLFLFRSKNSFPKPSCRVPFMPHWPELHLMPFLNQSLARGIRFLWDQSGLFLVLGLVLGLGSECPEACGCPGEQCRTPEQNGIYLEKGRNGEWTQGRQLIVFARPYIYGNWDSE